MFGVVGWFTDCERTWFTVLWYNQGKKREETGMSWEERTANQMRKEFVERVPAQKKSKSSLCRQVDCAVFGRRITRMAVLIVLHGKVPFVIPLPHLIGTALLKPLHWRGYKTGFFSNHSVALENIGKTLQRYPTTFAVRSWPHPTDSALYPSQKNQITQVFSLNQQIVGKAVQTTILLRKN